MLRRAPVNTARLAGSVHAWAKAHEPAGSRRSQRFPRVRATGCARRLADLDDRRMVQPGHGLGLVAEALAVPFVGLVLADALDRDVPVQTLVPGQEDLAHASLAQSALDAVGAEVRDCRRRIVHSSASPLSSLSIER